MHTYALMPNLLDLAPVGVALLRVAVGILFLGFGIKHARAVRSLPDSAHAAVRTMGWAYALLWMILGSLLTLGMYTQGAAAVGALATAYTYRGLVRTNSSSSARHLYTLLSVLCLSLILLGAGAFAVDVAL